MDASALVVERDDRRDAGAGRVERARQRTQLRRGADVSLEEDDDAGRVLGEELATGGVELRAGERDHEELRDGAPNDLGHAVRSALAVPMTVTVPSPLAHQTSTWARRRHPSATTSRTLPCAVIASPGQTTFTRRTSSFPPARKPAPYAAVITSATKQTDIIPCTTMSGNPSARAISTSVW